MACHSNEIPIDIVLSFTGLLPMHSSYSNSDTIKFALSRSKAKMQIFNNNVYFSVTSLALNDVHVREGNIIKPPHEKSVLVKSLQCFS